MLVLTQMICCKVYLYLQYQEIKNIQGDLPMGMCLELTLPCHNLSVISTYDILLDVRVYFYLWFCVQFFSEKDKLCAAQCQKPDPDI